ncbi:MAG: HD family phosphohydrolase [Lachnospira sp.]
MSYKNYRKKRQYQRVWEKFEYAVKDAHRRQDIKGKEYMEYVSGIFNSSPVQQMRKYNHHSRTNCLQHSVHVSYFNYLISKKLNWDTWAATKGGLLHDLFLYDWHEYEPGDNERLHGFEHPSKALKNARRHFPLTEKEGDIISKHMFPLTITPPKYKESYLLVLTDKFCSTGEVLDRFLKRKQRIKNMEAMRNKRGAKV